MPSGMKTSTFLERFTTLLDESLLTDTEIAKGLNVSKQTVSSWKSGRRSPKQPTIIIIAQYFHVSIEWLMGYDVDKYGETQVPQKESVDFVPIKTKEARILAQGFDRMPEAERKRALEMVKLIFAPYADLFEQK